MSLNIVLVEPEIPSNTGNIARTCAATGAKLHLIEPLGFDISEKAVRRAGLDYWDKVNLQTYKNIEEFFNCYPDANFLFATTKGKHNFVDAEYPEEVFILFGKETKGLPEDLLEQYPDYCIRIPMLHELRSLNLSNSVAIVAYKYFEKHNFKGFQTEGYLTKEICND